VTRIALFLGLSVLGLAMFTGCTVSTSLVPALPEEDGRFGIDTEIRQPFYAESDGLNRLTVRFHPEGSPASQVPLDPAHGASIELNYSPEDDPRFPEPSFHEWPDQHEWLPELTSDVQYEQTFCSPYPDLSGIEVRVATFGADISSGIGVLKSDETVEVLHLPVVGDHVGFLPGGSEVEVLGTTEGWVRIVLNEDQHGWVDIEHFEELPPPERENDRDVILRLYEIDGADPVRESVVNAGEMFDNSHVLFEFPLIEDAIDKCYRASIVSPDSEPGNAITLRYDPAGPYDEGQAILNGNPADGDLVFQPLYDLQRPLYSGYLEDYEWAAPLDAFEAVFAPVPDTAGRYLEIRVQTGDSSVNIPWSRNRPPGQLPLEVSGMPAAPQGGLIFNAAFHRDVPLGEVARVTGRDLYSRARIDTPFYVGLAFLLVGTIVAGGIMWQRSGRDGR
jgi:hypothetical protein